MFVDWGKRISICPEPDRQPDSPFDSRNEKQTGRGGLF